MLDESCNQSTSIKSSFHLIPLRCVGDVCNVLTTVLQWFNPTIEYVEKKEQKTPSKPSTMPLEALPPCHFGYSTSAHGDRCVCPLLGVLSALSVRVHGSHSFLSWSKDWSGWFER